MASVRAIVNRAEWQVESPVPFKIGEEDLFKFSQEESLLYFLKKQSPEVASLPNKVWQMVAAISANPEEELTPETLQQGYISFPEDPVSSWVQCGTEVGVGQWSGQPFRVLSDFSPVRPKTRRLEQPVRTTSGSAAPPQFSPFIHPGLQRSFSSPSRNDMIPLVPMAANPPGPFHPSSMHSPEYQIPVASMGQQGADKAAVSVLCPPVNLQTACGLDKSSTMAAYPVTTFTQISMTGANQPGTAVTRASVAESSARTQEINQTSAAVHHTQLHVPIPEHMDFTI